MKSPFKTIVLGAMEFRYWSSSRAWQPTVPRWISESTTISTGFFLIWQMIFFYPKEKPALLTQYWGTVSFISSLGYQIVMISVISHQRFIKEGQWTAKISEYFCLWPRRQRMWRKSIPKKNFIYRLILRYYSLEDFNVRISQILSGIRNMAFYIYFL